MASLLVVVGTAVVQGESHEEPKLSFSETELNDIVDRAYRLGYEKGYDEGSQEVIRPGDLPALLRLPSVPQVVPKDQTSLESEAEVSSAEDAEE